MAPLYLDAEGIQFSEAAAANHVWISLLRFPVAATLEFRGTDHGMINQPLGTDRRSEHCSPAGFLCF